MKTRSTLNLVEQIDAIRKSSGEVGGQYLTNLFLPLPYLQECIDSKQMEVLLFPSEAMLLLDSLPSGKRQLLFAASSTATLSRILVHYRAAWQQNTFCNLVGDRRRITDLIHLFEQAGFTNHACLRRMTRKQQQLPQPTTTSAATIRCAQPKDCKSIHRTLETVFDPWSEPVPTVEAMRAAASAGEILLACSLGSSLLWDALLWVERKGMVNLIRFWLRNPKSESNGAAGAVMRTLLENDGEKLTRLWVIEGNQNAIDRYCHYGFQFDAIETIVFTSKRINTSTL